MAKLLPARTVVLPLLVLAALALSPGRSASGAEITAFATGASPTDVWNTGYGGMLTITLFSFAHGEIEGCWQGSALPETSVSSLAAKAYFGPQIGPVVPYIGLGVGVYRESLPTKTDQGTSGMIFAGGKLKFPFGLVLRGEYQWLTLPDEVLQPLDNRLLFGVGLSF